MHIVGIDPDLDYLYDPQQDRRADHFPMCGCCGHRVYPGETFYELDVRGDTMIVCEDCKREMCDSPCTVEDVRYGG